MKYSMLTLCLVALFTVGSKAQSQELMQNPATQQQTSKPLSPSDRAKKEANMAEKKLALTGDQKMKWEAASLERVNANTPN